MRKSTKLILYGIPTTLLLSCAGGLLGFAHKSRTDRDLAVARLAEVGLPTDPDQIKHIPDPDKDAGELLKEFRSAFLKARKVPANFAFSSPNERSSKAFVKANPNLVRLRRQIFMKSELATQLEPTLGHYQLFPALEPFRNVVKLALAESQVSAADGHPVEAIKLCEETVRFVQLLGTDPNHMAELQLGSLQKGVNQQTSEIFARYSSRVDVRMAMRLYLNASIPSSDHRRAMIEDVSNALVLEANVRKGKINLPELMASIGSSPATAGDKATLNLYRIQGASEMLCAKLYQGYADLYASVPADLTQHKNRIDAAARWKREITGISAPNAFLVQSFVQDYVVCFETEAHLWAEWRSLNALLIASEIKAKTGRYPSALPVSGRDAIDPFTDKPLKYHLKRGKMTVYSVGDDLSDDDGLLSLQNYVSMPGSLAPSQDTGFSVPYDLPKRK